jgi:hypothetical protein
MWTVLPTFCREPNAMSSINHGSLPLAFPEKAIRFGPCGQAKVNWEAIRAWITALRDIGYKKDAIWSAYSNELTRKCNMLGSMTHDVMNPR